MALLEVRDLRVELATRGGVFPVIDGLDFTLDEGETLAFVGESGCGKSMTALAVMGLVPRPVGRIAAGQISFAGEDLAGATERRLQHVRGNEISMIFQEPMTSLNPVYTTGEQIAEVLRRHQGLGRHAAWSQAVELLDAVGIPDPASRAEAYPHQMSGGQRQRVMIAIALACRPKILIADEPTTALDVTVQAQIFDLLRELRRQTGTALILITHDMGAVAEMAERMIVMYAGRKAEEGPVGKVIAHPRHPYTRGLIACVPHLKEHLTEERAELTEIEGIVPPLSEFGQDACLFASRCPLATEKCVSERPPLKAFGAQRSACWYAEAV
jgi:oligopeptide/dipeptide ABC transporter ATP-binding protein